ncbi:LOW QUALITY PROTEIN: peroxisome assembly protein 26 [Neosynchiropus ocellatus]
MATVLPTPQPVPVKQMLDWLESAAQQLMLVQDFPAAFQACSSGLERLPLMAEEDSRISELKAGFCIVGIQALAEMNQWPGVLSWLLRFYESPESVPARILQMCIVLYSKVGDPAAVLEAAGAWLRCDSNKRVAGFGTVAELYLLHVLVPLGCVDRARQLILGEVGSSVFSEDQRLTALEVVEERENQLRGPSPSPGPGSDTSAALSDQGDHEAPGAPAQGHSGRPLADLSFSGADPHGLAAMLKAAYRKLLLSSSGSLLVHRLVLAAVLLSMLLLRLDPALPSSFLWISKLLHFLRHLWSHVTSLHSPSRNQRL